MPEDPEVSKSKPYRKRVRRNGELHVEIVPTNPREGVSETKPVRIGCPFKDYEAANIGALNLHLYNQHNLTLSRKGTVREPVSAPSAQGGTPPTDGELLNAPVTSDLRFLQDEARARQLEALTASNELKLLKAQVEIAKLSPGS